MQQWAQKQPNPLTNYMRQPKIYIRLPSQGMYWPKSSIEMSETGEIPVYSMTAKDELLFKTPDALINGQAVVDVIQSCIPNIKNAWDVPNLDLDFILLAIRIASDGDKLTLKHKIPVIKEETEHELDLSMLIAQLQTNSWNDRVCVSDDLTVYVKPLTYRHLTQTSLKSFETTRILNMVNDNSITDEEKINMFNSSFSKLTQITVDLMSESIYKIVTPDSEVTDVDFIKEFVNNADKSVFDIVNKHLSELKQANQLKPLTFTTTEEQQAQGAPATYSIPLNLNESDFFAQGF